MLLGDRISFGLLGLFATLLGFVACSADSAIDPNTAGSSHSAAGTPGIAGSSVSLAGASSTGSAGAASGAGSGQGGVASSAGAEGTNTAGAPSGPGGSASTPQAGSAGMTTGGTGPSSAGRGGNAGRGGSAGAAGASAAFRQVSTIFGKNCGIAGCHADKQSPHFSADAMLYATLTAGTVLAECDYNKMIEPGDPSKSALVQLMNRKCGTFTMPPSCNKTTCLSAADLQTLTDWVQAGAPT